MRILGLAVAGMLALTVPMAAHAVPPGSKMGLATTAPAPGIVQVWDGGGSGWHPAPGVGGGGWRPVPDHLRQWQGAWVPPHWGANGHPLGWGRYDWQGVPAYWVWGPSGGAFDYPFAGWRGRTGGWGNP
jgi:hypothetical protein